MLLLRTSNEGEQPKQGLKVSERKGPRGSWANEEAYENEFNQEGQGRKRQTFPLSTGRFAEDKEAVPLTRKGEEL